MDLSAVTPDINIGGRWWAETVFVAMVLLALGISRSRLGWPLKWAETFYHEFSHGMACILTGGDMVRLEIQWNGAGLCTTRGGWRVPILLAGYMGASVWGGFLYMAGWMAGAVGVTLWLKIELAILALVFVLWARDLKTWLILLLIGSVYVLAILGISGVFLPAFLQFAGIYVMLNALRAPLHLIDGQDIGDGAELAAIFKILPEGVWIAFWLIFALAVLALCALLTLPVVHDWGAPLVERVFGVGV